MHAKITNTRIRTRTTIQRERVGALIYIHLPLHMHKDKYSHIYINDNMHIHRTNSLSHEPTTTHTQRARRLSHIHIPQYRHSAHDQKHTTHTLITIHTHIHTHTEEPLPHLHWQTTRVLRLHGFPPGVLELVAGVVQSFWWPDWPAGSPVPPQKILLWLRVSVLHPKLGGLHSICKQHGNMHVKNSTGYCQTTHQCFTYGYFEFSTYTRHLA